MVSTGQRRVRIAGAVIVILLLSVITVNAFRGRGRRMMFPQRPAWDHKPGDMLTVLDVSSKDEVGIATLSEKLKSEGFEIIEKRGVERPAIAKNLLVVKVPAEGADKLKTITEEQGISTVRPLDFKRRIRFAPKGPRIHNLTMLVPNENVTDFIKGASAANITAIAGDGHFVPVIVQLLGREHARPLGEIGKRFGARPTRPPRNGRGRPGHRPVR